ncbi:hypothetical protein [Streptomyces sp. VRA16 Mangrove soil]|uniref:hypothetical protein n=1 Tax=Streptomyces sp. VRA16 Mangrove soil TaxID=2817434 RepID=UPI001A9E7F28|nr:hypothetical protein [Streptomyces sp. VRA16 Mangrove soil]MBO1335164.1 hypothetical protein [Streptomyces sp. VRA16 Mangrove soil]
MSALSRYAPSDTRTAPAPTSGVDIRLPWWAIVLPAVAFVALLLLILNPADGQTAAADPSVAHLLERARALLLP